MMIEAMACGTPVIAYNRGSVPEVIKDKKTGFIVKNVSEAVKAVHKIDQIKRSDCRDWVKERFSIDTMVDGYEKAYFDLIQKKA
jgi:glycosyltransferase involved in cell wall biosynthesis